MSLPSSAVLPIGKLVAGKWSLRTRLGSRRRQRLLHVSFDLLALMAAWRLTIELRLLLNPLMPMQFSRAELQMAAPPLSGMLFLWIVAALWLGVYRPRNGAANAAAFDGILKAVLLAGTLAIVVTFFSREFGTALSRSFVLLFLPVSFLLTASARWTALVVGALGERKWPTQERVAVLGHSPRVRQMVDQMQRAEEAEFEVVGVILPTGASARGLGNCAPVIGTVGQLGEVINRRRLDRILIAEDGPSVRQDSEECTRIAKRMGVTVSRAVRIPDRGALVEFTALPGLSLLDLKPVYFTRRQELVKRAFDVLVAALCLFILAPVIVLTVFLIKLTSKGPALFRSQRVGRGGRHFPFLKFRSMYLGAEKRGDLAARNEKSGHIFKMRNDPRVTPVGRQLRRYSIDELPQLLNVLRGEMSLVGPRPLPAQDLDADGQSRRFRAWADQRSGVLPGITGLWQVQGRSELSFEKMMELDTAYIRDWSLVLDLRILLKTPLAVLQGRGAY